MMEQGSDSWHDWRSEGLGASDAAVVMGVSPFMDTDRLLLELTGQAQPQDTTFAMRRGLRLEPVARVAYERRFGLRMTPCCVQHDRHPWMRASLDGLSRRGDLVLEIKAPNEKAHAEALGGVVPAYYYPQCQHQLAVTECRYLHYWSMTEHSRFTEDEKYALVWVSPNPEYIAELIDAEGEFWRIVVEARKQLVGV